ncbi:hypothetical protein, partial [Rhodoblastus acidophilus]|uniref:hypothetical protein n=1 Tax=Rhodoblastus acidophilus TaxID=1074 RepID=UPI0022257344
WRAARRSRARAGVSFEPFCAEDLERPRIPAGGELLSISAVEEAAFWWTADAGRPRLGAWASKATDLADLFRKYLPRTLWQFWPLAPKSGGWGFY